MTETAIADGAKKGAGILRRKVFGVPVLYLAIVFVAVLAFYAWRTRTAPSGEPEYEADVAGEDFTNPADPRTLYPISPTGTVYAQSPQAVEDNAEYFGNDQWLQKAVAGMVSKGKNPGEAQNALQAYLEGEDLSYVQGLLRDQAIKEYGLPPESFRAGVSAGKPLPTPKPKPEPVKPSPTPKPVPKPAPKPAPPKTKTYTVRKNDTLWDISAKFYNGNSLKWKDIANRNNIRNPRSLQIGRVLVIP